MSVRDRVATCSKYFSRSRVLPIAAIACAMLFAACSKGPRSDLAIEFSTDLEIGADKQPAVHRDLAAGAYLVEVRESEIDTRTTIETAGKHIELADQAPRHGSIFEVVSLEAPAQVGLRIGSADHETKTGRVHVIISRWKRAPQAKPSELELGFAAFGAAGEESAINTPESLTRAADKLHEALTHFDAAGDDAARAAAAYELANVQYSRSEWTACVGATETATKAYESADDDAGVHNSAALRSAAELELAAAMNAGTQRAEQDAMFAAADRRLKQAAEFFSAHALPVRAAYAVNMRGIGALSVGDYDTADGFFTTAGELSRANHDVAEQTKSLSNLAWIHYRRGFVAQSAREYETLLPLIDKNVQAYLYAILLGNYGFTLIALGDFDRALELHLEALDLYTRLGNQSERANELAALGGLYLRMGDTGRALETLRAAIIAQEKVSDTSGLAITLRVASNAASELGLHDQSLEYLRRSAQIDGNPHSRARASVQIAAELRALGKVDAADAELAVPLASSDTMVRATALEERAAQRAAKHDGRGAIEDLRSADREYTTLGLDFKRIDTNTALSRLLLAANDVAGASATADEAIAIVSRIRTKSANPEWRARFLSSRYSPYEVRIAADIAAGPEPIAAAWRAFRTADEVRARSLADQMANAARRGLAAGSSADEDLRARLTLLQLRLEARIQRQDPDEAGTLEVRRSIEETRAQIDRARLTHGVAAAADGALPDSFQEMQQGIPAGTAVLAFFVGDESSHAWLLSRNGLRHTTLAGREPVRKAVDEALDEMRGSVAPHGAMRKLSAMLLGSLLEGAAESRLLLIPDGPLNGVPFAALPIDSSGSQLLVDRFAVSYAPSLMLAMKAPRRPAPHALHVAVVSDPVYASDDRRLRLASSGANGNFRGPASPSVNRLTRLPYSALEASAVSKAFREADTIQLSGFDANAQRVGSLSSGELTVLHFATHAQVRRDAPEQSALYLSEYSPDGHLLPESALTVADISRLGLRADLVVLSGCATGDGSELRGEGVLGLTYGFLANGSHSVVASLWPIEDATTARFMSDFYKSYRATGNVADALRSAQLSTRSNTSAAVWSSFVMRANQFP